MAKMFESPFTWNIDPESIRNYNEDKEFTIDADEEPDVFILLKFIMITYIRTVKKDSNGALKNIEATSEMWEKFSQSLINNSAISSKVLFHVMKATEYYVYKGVNNAATYQRIYNELEDSSAFKDRIERATINGCKSLAWTSFHERGWKDAITHARKAVDESPDYALWHYLLAKNLSYSRRYSTNDDKLSDEEKKEWLRCYELSKTPFYGIHVADMYKRNRQWNEANDLYSQIFRMNPLNVNINLRLALGFTTSKDFAKAKGCLDLVERKAPGNSMFLHYKGIYFEKQKKFGEAADWFEKAASDTKNFGADLQYLNAKFKVDKQFDRIQHLKSMLIKYKDNAKYKQQILLHLAMHYYDKMSRNVRNAQENVLSYFLEAVEVDPKNNILTKFVNFTLDWKPYDIYNFIENQVLPHYQRENLNPPEKERKFCESLKVFCEQRTRKKIGSIARSVSAVNVS